MKSKYTVRADGRIVHTVTINGKRKYFYGNSDREIEKKMLAYKQDISHGRRFSDIAEEWQLMHESNVDIATNKAYKYPLEKIIDYLGDEHIADIEPQAIKTHLNELLRQGYSAKTIRRYLSIYCQIFDYACEIGECTINAARNVTLPKMMPAPERREPATPDQEKIIKEHADEWLLPFFLLRTGCRRNEALAIQYKDIDRQNKTIYITKAVKYDAAGHPHIAQPKTAAGNRIVPLLDDLAAMIPDPGKGHEKDYIFGGAEPIGSNAYNRYWAAFQAATGVNITAHQLRHSYATTLYEAQIDTKMAADLLGHADMSLTAKLYEHIRKGMQEEAAKKLNKHIKKHIKKSSK